MYICETFQLLLVVSQWPRMKNDVEYVCLENVPHTIVQQLYYCNLLSVCEHHVGHFCCCVLEHVECCQQPHCTLRQQNVPHSKWRNSACAEYYYIHIDNERVAYLFRRPNRITTTSTSTPDTGSFLNNDQFAFLHNILSVVGVFFDHPI